MGPNSHTYYENMPSLEYDARARVQHSTSPDGRKQMVEATVYLPDDMIRKHMFFCYATNHLIIYGEFDTFDMQWHTLRRKRYLGVYHHSHTTFLVIIL